MTIPPSADGADPRPDLGAALTGTDAASGRGQAPPVSVPERELKFRMDDRGRVRTPDLLTAGCGVGAVRDGGVRGLTTTYYDTPDLRLIRDLILLRRREGGPDAGWHVKLPPDRDGVREELQLPLSAGTPGEPPAVFVWLLRGRTRAVAVEPVTTLRTRRSVLLLDGEDGAPIAELVDDAVSVLDGTTIVTRFRELELESLGADAAQLRRVADALRRAGAVESGPESKASRALGPAATAASDLPSPSRSRPKDPAGEAVRAHLAKHARRLADEDLRVRRDQPDSVHQMRVAARRLRSGLKVFRPLIEPQWGTHLRDELAWIAAVLGEVRDREVLEQRLLAALAALPAEVSTTTAERAVHADLESGMAQARAQVLKALDSPRYLALLDDLVDAIQSPRLTPAADAPARRALPPLVRKAWRRLERDCDALTADTPDAVWHQTRIAAKGARYATEAVAPIFGGHTRVLAAQAERITELLGEYHDTAVTRSALQRIALRRGVSGSAGFALGLVHAHEHNHAMALRTRFLDEAWPATAKARRRVSRPGAFDS